jgi:hypothetical protein
MGYEDHFTSHLFRSLYWMSFEAYVKNRDPDQSSFDDNNIQATDTDSECDVN